jgi:hypothetical protein
VKRPEAEILEPRGGSLQSPPNITSNRGSISGLARGLGRLALSPRAQGGRRGPKDKPDEKKVHEPCAWREAYAARFKAEVGPTAALWNHGGVSVWGNEALKAARQGRIHVAMYLY